MNPPIHRNAIAQRPKRSRGDCLGEDAIRSRPAREIRAELDEITKYL